jgi:nitrogen fixation NifU-like protein
MSPQYTEKVMEHFTNPHNVGEIPDADGIGEVGNPVCLVGGTLIQMNNHYQGIEEVQQKERVLTHEGVYSTVEQRSVRDYSGQVVRLKNKLGSVEMTPEHLVLAIKRSDQHKYNYTRYKKKLKAEWHHVSDLQPRDIALYPILKVTRDQEYFDLDFVKKELDFRSFDLPEKVPVDADFLRLAGYYLSEGNAVTTVTKAHICFTFHIDEVEFQQDVVRIVKDKFGLNAQIKPREGAHAAYVIVNSANLARVFEKTFGKGAESKHIPDFMLFLSPEKQVHLLNGLWRGDGYVNLEGKRARAGYATISVQLAGQIKTLLLRQGIIPSMYKEKGSVMENISHSEAYRIHVGDVDSLKKLCSILGVECALTGTSKEHSWISDGFLYTPITSMETLQFAGKVHNFEIAEQHSYVTDAFTVHNCGDLMYIYITVKDDILTDVKFKTFGCGAAIATSSMITDLARGKTLEEGLKISRKDVADSLGGLPPQKMHCSNLAADGLHEAIHDYLRKQGREPPLPPDAKKAHEEEDDHCVVDVDSPIHIEDTVPKQ